MLFEKMRDAFAEIIRELVEKGGYDKIVFYVDDLDRLKPSRAVELLEVMKNFLDVEGAIFVLAIDYDVIVRGLQGRKGYEGAAQTAGEYKNFFDKIIQVPYRMPTASYDTAKFLSDHFNALHGKKPGFELPKLKQLLDASIGNNPRSIKRLLNLHALLRELVIVNKGTKLANEQFDQLLVLTCIQMAYPWMYLLLARIKERKHLVNAIVSVTLMKDIHEAVIEASGEKGLGFDEEAVLAEIIKKGRGGPFKNLIVKDEAAFADAVQFVMDDRIHSRNLQGDGPATDRDRQNMGRLAELFFESIDKDKNKEISTEEWNRLADVLILARSTVISSEEAQEAPVEAVGTRAARVNFYHLLAAGPDGRALLSPDAKLIFRDPKERENGVFDSPPEAYPNLADKGGLMLVKFERAEKTRLSVATRTIFERIKERVPTVELGEAERRGAVPVVRYWVVKQNGTEVPLSDLVDEYRRTQGISQTE